MCDEDGVSLYSGPSDYEMELGDRIEKLEARLKAVRAVLENHKYKAEQDSDGCWEDNPNDDVIEEIKRIGELL